MKNKIYEAAKKAFLEYGYKGATVERIAGLVGVPISLVTYYFKKEEILLQIYRDYWLRVTELVDREAGAQCENKFQWYLLFHRIFYSSLVSDACDSGIYREIYLRRVADPLLQEYNDPVVREIIDQFHLENSEPFVTYCIQAEYGARRETLHAYQRLDPERDKETFYFLATIAVRMAGLGLEETRGHVAKAEAIYLWMGKPLAPLI